jgi:hypothetical protein
MWSFFRRAQAALPPVPYSRDQVNADICSYIFAKYGLKLEDYWKFRETRINPIMKEMGFPPDDQMTIKHPAFIEAIRRAGGKMPPQPSDFWD